MNRSHFQAAVGLAVAGQVLSAVLAMSSALADVAISKKPTANMACSSGVCTATAESAVLNINDLAGMLASGDVKVASGRLAQDIRINSTLSWTSTSRLTLDSYRAITFNEPVDVAGTGALTITTNDGGKNGDFTFPGKGRVKFWDSHSGLTINGKNYILVKNISALAKELRNDDGTGRFFALYKSGGAGRKSYFQSPITREFEGTFEGLGNTISHLTISGSTGNIALFAAIGLSGAVRDLHLANVSISVGGFGGQFVGPLVGGNGGVILNCDASGQVFVSGAQSFAGGLVGGNVGTITHSSASTVITDSSGDAVVGGLVGENGYDGQESPPGYIYESYATGAVTGGDGAMVGGLVGENASAAVYNSYATGAVTGGDNAYVGGLLGSHLNAFFAPLLRSSYSTGAVRGGTNATVGGLIGQDDADTRITHSYWDMDTSGISDPSQGAGNVQNDKGITGLTTEQFQSGLPKGFDRKLWAEKPGINNGYPYLIGLPPG